MVPEGGWGFRYGSGSMPFCGMGRFRGEVQEARIFWRVGGRRGRSSAVPR